MINEKKIHIVICDDQSIVCEGLRAILESESKFIIDGLAHNGLEVISLVAAKKPDLVLMDVKMPLMDGVEATRIIHENNPDTKVIILTTYDTDEYIVNAIRNGAEGYLLKDLPREELFQSIIDTINGLHHIDPQVAGTILQVVSNPHAVSCEHDQRLIDTLNNREREILQFLGKGFTNAEIAQTLYLTEGTVKNNVSAILSKLGVNDRTQAALMAVKNGIV
jgi:DNA-binding NarL/FixJ family response regulator